MRGTKVKAILKMQSECDHHVNPQKTRNCMATVHWMTCEDCGARMDRLRPLSPKATRPGSRWFNRLPEKAKEQMAAAARLG